MDFDTSRVSRYAPVALPVVVLIAGWLLLVQPRVTGNARIAREMDTLRYLDAVVRNPSHSDEGRAAARAAIQQIMSSPAR